MKNFFHITKNKLLDIFLPRKCFVCKKSGAYFCEPCFARLPSGYRDDIPAWISVLKNYRQSPHLQKALWKLKYRGTQALADDFGIHLYETFLNIISEEELAISGREILLVPIPISKKRYKERGYNQAELLARALLRAYEKENAHEKNISVKIIPHALVKTKDTVPQATLKRRSNRLKNMDNVFSAHYSFENKVVILIDDIVTTGATLKDARRAGKIIFSKSLLSVPVENLGWE